MKVDEEKQRKRVEYYGGYVEENRNVGEVS
jgi:hypothetical protein